MMGGKNEIRELPLDALPMTAALGGLIDQIMKSEILDAFDANLLAMGLVQRALCDYDRTFGSTVELIKLQGLSSKVDVYDRRVRAMLENWDMMACDVAGSYRQ